MLLRQLIRWGAWPALVTGAVIVIFGGYGLIVAWRQLGSGDNNPGSYVAIFGMIGGVLAMIVGGLVILAAWLTRRQSRSTALSGIILSFFLAGLITALAVIAKMGGLLLAGTLGAVASLVLAGGTGLAARETPQRG